MTKPNTKEPESFVDGDIDGVAVKPLSAYCDDRGWLIELFRQDELDQSDWPTMSYVSQTLPGVARGPHEHVFQTDYFAFIGPGSFTLYLWDIRADSPSWGKCMKLVVGEDDKAAVLVPPGVVHAYRNSGDAPGWVFNAPNRLYAGENKQEPVDEVRHEDRPDSPFLMD